MTKLDKYQTACHNLALEVSEKYADGEVHWIADRVGEIAGIGDAFLSMSDIAIVAELSPTVEQFWDAYWKSVDEKAQINLENLIKEGKNE